MALVSTINVIAQSQNETNETDIGENQSISGRMSGFGEGLDFGPRVVDEPPITVEINSTIFRYDNMTIDFCRLFLEFIA
jgi:hypothetical protein